MTNTLKARRRFLSFLAASPLLLSTPPVQNTQHRKMSGWGGSQTIPTGRESTMDHETRNEFEHFCAGFLVFEDAFTVPPVVVTLELAGGGLEADEAATFASAEVATATPAGAASTKADGGNPPIVSASAAFKA